MQSTFDAFSFFCPSTPTSGMNQVPAVAFDFLVGEIRQLTVR
jgi:hypothetical protein